MSCKVDAGNLVAEISTNYAPLTCLGPGGTLLRFWMRQLCAVDLVGLDVCDRAFDGCGTEDSKPVRGLIRGVHLLLALPQSHREHLAFLWVGKQQAATETRLHPECREEVLLDLTLLLLEALRVYGVLAYPREHNTTAFPA